MRRIITFITQTWAELGKVVWPTRRRTLRLTVMVIIVSIFFGAFIGAVDFGLTKALEQVVANQGKPANNSNSVQVPAGGSGQGQQGQPIQLPAGADQPNQPQSK